MQKSEHVYDNGKLKCLYSFFYEDLDEDEVALGECRIRVRNVVKGMCKKVNKIEVYWAKNLVLGFVELV